MKKNVDYFTLPKSRIKRGAIVLAGSVIIVVAYCYFFVCNDLCGPPCPGGGPYAFVAGSFNVETVEGNQRRVDPIFSTTACCSESCCLIFSRCNSTTVSKIVAAPDSLALTNEAGVAQAQAQIAAAITAGRIAPPAFVAADCP